MGNHRRESYNAQQGDPAATPPNWLDHMQGRYDKFAGSGRLAEGAPDFNTLLAQWAGGDRLGPIMHSILAQHGGQPGAGPVMSGAPIAAPGMGPAAIAPVVPTVLPPSNGLASVGQPAAPMGGLGQGPQVPHPAVTAALAQALMGRSHAGGNIGGIQPLPFQGPVTY